MKRKSTLKIFASILACSMLCATGTPLLASVPLQETEKTIVGTDIAFDFDAYQEIQSELDSVMSALHNYNKSEGTCTTYAITEQNDETYTSLLAQRDTLLSQLDDIGALLDMETLAKFPAPSSSQTRSSLTGNLAELAEYYEDWFAFTGYEETVTYNGSTYQSCVVTVRDISGNGGLLHVLYNEVELISRNEVSNTDSFLDLANTVFGVFADSISGALDLSLVRSWSLSTMFSSLFNSVNTGAIAVSNLNELYYNYRTSFETNLYYGYIWNDATDKWVYCASSGKVYVKETHELFYHEFVESSGSQYEERSVTSSKNYSITPANQSDLCYISAQLYSNYGNNAPSYYETYQLNGLEVKRKWSGNAYYQELGDDFYYYIVSCDSPGDLWTLGSLN